MSEFVYELPKNWMMLRNVLFVASQRWHRKREAAFVASQECHCTEAEGVKCAVVCYFQRRMFDPTNLLNHMAPSIELMMQMSNLILIITALCNDWRFGTSAFNTVVWWCKLGEVENEYTSHNFSLFAIFLPKIVKIGGHLTKFWQKQFCTVFFETQCTTL